MSELDYVDKLFEVGELPPLSVVPKKMHAWTLRSNRLGEPLEAFREEIVPVPELRKGELLIANICAGINYNGVWAAKGQPKNVVDSNGDYGDEKEEFHICGSEVSGIVYAVGEGVSEFKVGDSICAGGPQYDRDCPLIREGIDPCFSPSYRIWGYEGNWGAFAQFSRVQENQCVAKPKFMSWAEAATSTATGVTVYRMLHRWKENEVKKGDVVLIWGGYGGIGTAAIPLVKAAGAIPIAVVSDDEKGKKCMELGAKGYINRKKYSHWGSINGLTSKEYRRWIIQANKFKKELWSIVGENKSPAIVIEHPGADTLPTSIFVCETGGMVVICGATSSYIGSLDLRFLWLNQKRLQGCHAGTKEDYQGYIRTLTQEGIKPVVSKVFEWKELPEAHQYLLEQKNFGGKFAVQIGRI
ncbi:crotonyl-CoA carboxylase/reductase [Anaerocolumna xylanovorans]|uniref:Crotonyl-CoA carboxylase/reductase n=1 Tax=Anaerocolumna xylanovorans DSM 12503 TaxID=1121345 RepID=A0A1M7YI72_9FIRM|nr:crotonyl-CoA carboxylase/reductase [Anaerocolumna xylanovorans]SHO52325.1 crotonyl-CoA carboxylase/reductase [Anaerocolumna xylanovorans DSM 12503]